MVQVIVSMQHNDIIEVDVKGHAKSGPHGQDLVCAAVSSICVGVLNALDELSKGTCSLDMNEAHVHIQRIMSCERAQIILQTLYIELLTIEKSHKELIKITKVEV